ncbi:MAG: hypothetical protein RL324_206 [Verrucomicrobiota bacterium]|jgi:hypothetical protein
MKWIVLSIVLFVAGYTFVTLHYRKSDKSFEPYQDLKDKANTGRLLSAGFQRLALGFSRPTDPGRTGAAGSGAAAIATGPGGLPADLTQALIDQPLLPLSIDSVTAAASASAAEPYLIQFTATLADMKQQPAGGLLYRREKELIVIPTSEKLTGTLLARDAAATVLLTLPAGSLPAGQYRVTVAGSRTARTWTLQVH